MSELPPRRIWLLDYGSLEATWCDDPSPSGEDHGAVEYVRADVGARNEALEEAARVAECFCIDTSASQLDDRDLDKLHDGALAAQDGVAEAIRALKSTNPPAEQRVSETPTPEHENSDVSGGRTGPAEPIDHCGWVETIENEL